MRRTHYLANGRTLTTGRPYPRVRLLAIPGLDYLITRDGAARILRADYRDKCRKLAVLTGRGS